MTAAKARLVGSSSLGYAIVRPDGTLGFAKLRRGAAYRDLAPVIGDEVLLDDAGLIAAVLPRKTMMARPRVANADQAAVVVAAREPDFSSFLLDKYLTACTDVSVPALIVITKWDLLASDRAEALADRLAWYAKLGYAVFKTGLGIPADEPALKAKLAGKTTILLGQTGVGKSSLANRLDASFNRSVGVFDKAMGRGRHKTKEVVLLPFLAGYLGDSPGFSDFSLDIPKDDLAREFPGYGERSYECLFKGCLHDHIKGCAVEKAVAEDRLSKDSQANYLKLLAEATAVKGYERKSSHSTRGKERRS